MPEVVSQVIAVVFQHVEALVLDLPAGSRASRNLDHVVRGEWQTGHEGTVIRNFSLVIGDGDPQPVNRERILLPHRRRPVRGDPGLAVAQRNRSDPAAAIGQAALAGPALDHHALVQRRAIHILIQRLVAVPFAYGQKVRARCQHGFGQRLATEQCVAQIDRAQVLDSLAMRAQAAFGCVALAILFLGSILRRDELGHQRQHRVLARGDDHGRQHGVIMLCLPVGSLARKTLRATQLLRTEILRAIEGHQRPSR